MAKKSTIARERKRERLVAQHRARRNELRKAMINPKLTEDERQEIRFQLAKLPRDA